MKLLFIQQQLGKLKPLPLLLGIALGATAVPALAHFLVVYTPQTALIRATDLPFHRRFPGPKLSLLMH